MQITRFYRHAWLLITNVRQGEIAPAAGDVANIQSWHPAIRRFKYKMQAAGGAHQKRHRSQQQ
ncbi:Uncharacterised protein [Shigella sonnei]|nr:Uncharacterised protein [Shigella sonnei]